MADTKLRQKYNSDADAAQKELSVRPRKAAKTVRMEKSVRINYDAAFFDYIDRMKDKKFSRTNPVWVCSTTTNEIYKALKLDLLYGSITNNVSDSQYKELIAISPIIAGQTRNYDSPDLSFLQDGTKIRLPNGRIEQVRIIRRFASSALFEAGGRKYVAERRITGGIAHVAIGEASQWDNDYPTGTYNLEKLGANSKAEMQYLQVKSKDPNLAINYLRSNYETIIADRGKTDYLLFGYENSILSNYRHSVFYKNMYRLSGPFVVSDNRFEAEGGSVADELGAFLINIPTNARASSPYVDDHGRYRMDFSWEKNVCPAAGKPSILCRFNGQLVLDIDPITRSGKAYYFEQARHSGGVDGDLQGAKLVPLDVVRTAEGFRLEFNHLLMIENNTVGDFTHAIGEGGISAHIIYPAALRADFDPIAEFDYKMFGVGESERARMAEWVYGYGRFNHEYGLGNSKFAHLITGNLLAP